VRQVVGARRAPAVGQQVEQPGLAAHPGRSLLPDGVLEHDQAGEVDTGHRGERAALEGPDPLPHLGRLAVGDPREHGHRAGERRAPGHDCASQL
jgi:hypothetical protein